MEKIISITEESFDDGIHNYDGFIIKTDQQDIKIGIDNCQQCCEQWGYFMSDDDLKDFIGSKLIEIVLTDESLNTETFTNNLDEYDRREACILFVTFKTNKGDFQFTAYNSHNGYYSHDAVVISEQLNISESL